MEYLKSLVSKVKDVNKSELKESIKESPFLYTFATIGYITAALYGCKFLKYLWRYVLRPKSNLHKEYGNGWAIVAGGSDGIGYEYCKLLGASGFNICILARNKTKMEEKAAELTIYLRTQGIFSLQIKTIVADFGEEFLGNNYERVTGEIQSLGEIAILVNCIGESYACEYESISPKMIHRILNVNALSAAYLTRIALPLMLKRAKKGAIINVSCLVKKGNIPHFALYAASKSFLSTFSKSLACEFQGKIDIMCVNAGCVTTRQNPNTGYNYITPKIAAHSHLSKLGKEVSTIGHPKHVIEKLMINSSWMANLRKQIGTEVSHHFKGTQGT